MFEELTYKIHYLPKHVYKILRGKIVRGGSKISPKEFDKVILDLILTNTIMDYYTKLPDERLSSALKSVNKKLPVELVNMAGRINEFAFAHRPLNILPIGIMNTIIWMERFGIKEYHVYFALLEQLDTTPANSFSDYVRIITNFEKEMFE